MSEAVETLRLDVWLWRARFFKTRTLATDYVNGRGVRISRAGQVRKVTKPSATIIPGDVLTFSRGGTIHIIEVLAIGTRRGPASEAATLYQTVEGS